MRRAFLGLHIGLQRIAQQPHKRRDRGEVHLMAHLAKPAGDLSHTLRRPPQKRLGIAPESSSTRRSMSSRIVGSLSSSDLRPPPGRRTLPGSSLSPDSNSAIPLRIVSIAIPVARAVAMTPPQPAARASLAAHNRRWRSFNSGAIDLNRSPIAAYRSPPKFYIDTTKPAELFFYQSDRSGVTGVRGKSGVGDDAGHRGLRDSSVDEPSRSTKGTSRWPTGRA